VANESIDTAADLVRVLNHPTRLRLLNLLTVEGPLCVRDIVAKLQVDQATCSHHLSELWRAELLTRTRVDRFTHYGINRRKTINTVAKQLVAIVTNAPRWEA